MDNTLPKVPVTPAPSGQDANQAPASVAKNDPAGAGSFSYPVANGDEEKKEKAEPIEPGKPLLPEKPLPSIVAGPTGVGLGVLPAVSTDENPTQPQGKPVVAGQAEQPDLSPTSDSALPKTEGSSLSDLAKKLSSWKDDYLKEQKSKHPGSSPVLPPTLPENKSVGSSGFPAVSPQGTSQPALPTAPTPTATDSLPPLPPASDKTSGSPSLLGGDMSSLPVSTNFAVKSSHQASPAIVTTANQGPLIPKGATQKGKYPYTVDQLLQLVVDKDASDLHLGVGYSAKIRIDGQLVNVSDDIITDEAVQELLAPVLPENKRELLEVNREVDLAYAFKDSARFRINAFYERGSPAGAFRLIPNRIRTIEELKLPGSYRQLSRLPQGFVLVTGPTGHGKSTTLAAMIQEINENRPVHIITIEDPIEYVYPKAKALVDQREMHEDTHSWEIALRSALRQDPDVVLVGEMRDFETIAAAITIAETGHLVFATLHTNNAAQTVDRIIDVFPEHQQSQIRVQLANILEAVISQRLIPIKGGGRRAVSEIMLCNPAVRSLIREGKTHQLDNVIRTSADIGMKTLEHSLVELVREGAISVEDAEANAINPEEISRLLK